MRNHRNDIKNELAYFYIIIKNMDIKDNIKNSKVKEHEFSLEEVIYDNCSNDFDVDKQVAKQSLLSVGLN